MLESYSEVVLPEGCEIVPPRMAGVNNVSEFTLGLTSTANKNLSAYFEKHRGEDDREPDENDFESDETQSQRELEFSSILQQIAKVEAATRKLQLPLWVGAIALIVLANLIA